MRSDYEFIAQLLSVRHEEENFHFNELLLAGPVTIHPDVRERRNKNYFVIKRFYENLKNLFRSCLFSEGESDILKLLLNDSQERLPLMFHKNLPDSSWTVPIFFRTDESRNGKIFEIQNPGSGWADPILLEHFYDHRETTRVGRYNVHETFIKDVVSLTRCDEPCLLHLIDSSSNPSMMRYFITITSKPLKYWGFNREVSQSNIHLVRGHSVYGIINENLFNHRLKQVDLGQTIFDLPPLVIFDQKIPYSLPFLKETAHHFDDEIREAFVYTTILFVDGFWDMNGEFVTIAEFLKRPPHSRRYYLKYGGCDTSLNWGSRAVYRLDSNKASILLKRAVDDFKRSRPWIIQPDLGEKEEIQYCSPLENEDVIRKLPAKYSTFYGPSGVYAIRCHHRQSTKVHGQSDSIVGLAY